MSSMIGVQPDATSTAAKAGLLDRFTGPDGKEYVYVQANGAIGGEGYVCVIDEAGQAEEVDTTNSATTIGQACGVAQVAFADDDYGWLQIYGVSNVQVSASAAANVALNSTATDGQLDDDASTGAEVIDGIVLTTARGGTAGTAPGYLQYPRVGATIPA